MTDKINIGPLEFVRDGKQIFINDPNEYVGYCEFVPDEHWEDFVAAASPKVAESSPKLNNTDEEVIKAVDWCYDNVSKSVTPLSVWKRLYDQELTDTSTLEAVTARLHKLARERKIYRHSVEGSRWAHFRPIAMPLPLFCNPWRG